MRQPPERNRECRGCKDKRLPPPKCFSIQSVPGLDTPVMYVRGVGPKVAELLAAKDIRTAEDLLYHLPFRYEDRQKSAQPG